MQKSLKKALKSNWKNVKFFVYKFLCQKKCEILMNFTYFMKFTDFGVAQKVQKRAFFPFLWAVEGVFWPFFGVFFVYFKHILCKFYVYIF